MSNQIIPPQMQPNNYNPPIANNVGMNNPKSSQNPLGQNPNSNKRPESPSKSSSNNNGTPRQSSPTKTNNNGT